MTDRVLVFSFHWDVVEKRKTARFSFLNVEIGNRLIFSFIISQLGMEYGKTNNNNIYYIFKFNICIFLIPGSTDPLIEDSQGLGYMFRV